MRELSWEAEEIESVAITAVDRESDHSSFKPELEHTLCRPQS